MEERKQSFKTVMSLWQYVKDLKNAQQAKSGGGGGEEEAQNPQSASPNKQYKEGKGRSAEKRLS